jgi:hypothetical protein
MLGVLQRVWALREARVLPRVLHWLRQAVVPEGNWYRLPYVPAADVLEGVPQAPRPVEQGII